MQRIQVRRLFEFVVPPFTHQLRLAENSVLGKASLFCRLAQRKQERSRPKRIHSIELMNWNKKKERLFVSLGVVAKEDEDDKDETEEERERLEREQIVLEEEALVRSFD